jgi:hypothetical protein
MSGVVAVAADLAVCEQITSLAARKAPQPRDPPDARTGQPAYGRSEKGAT